MEKILKTGCGIIAGILIAGIAGLVIYFVYLGSWYHRVQAEMPSIKQKLIEMNHKSLSHIPVPEGVTLISQEDLGVKAIPDYGVSTYVDYQASDPELDVLAYYQSALEPLGWQLLGTSIDNNSATYANAGTCLRIRIHSNSPGYTFLLYQDFAAQEFSPELPPMWYVNFREAGKTSISTCP